MDINYINDYFRKYNKTNEIKDGIAISYTDNKKIYDRYVDVYETKKDVKGMMFISEILIITLIYYLTYSPLLLTNLITIDSVIVAITFSMQYHNIYNKRFLCHIMKSKKILYYLYFLALYSTIDVIFWYKIHKLFIITLPFIMCPSIIYKVTNIYLFRVCHKYVYEVIESIFYELLCKQMAKLINMISEHSLNYNPKIHYSELELLIKTRPYYIYINFVSGFVFASILQYFENNGTTIYTMVFRQLYFKQYFKEDIVYEDYIASVLRQRKWELLTDPYTLNIIIQIFLNNNKKNSVLAKHVKSIKQKLDLSFTKIACCWTIWSVLKIKYVGILSYLLFFKHTKINYNNVIKLSIIVIHLILSYFSQEQLIQIILCETLTLLIMNNVTKTIVLDIVKKTKIKIRKYQHQIIDIDTLILMLCVGLFGINQIVFLFVIASIINLYTHRRNIWYQLLFVLLFGYISKYNIFHCLILSFLSNYIKLFVNYCN